jgi:hypothetical protein
VQFDRQADHLVPAAGDRGQVQALDDPYAGLEEGLVDLGPVGVLPADRQVVDPDGAHLRLGQVHGGLLGDAHEILDEILLLCQHRSELDVRNRIRSPGCRSCLLNSPAVISRGSSIWITRAWPIVAVSGISSSPLAPWMKCTGASIWVPLWTPMARWETLHSSPRPVSITRCNTIGGLSGQCGIPCLTVTDTSIQPVISDVITGLRHSVRPGSLTARLGAVGLARLICPDVNLSGAGRISLRQGDS